jgi:hypothetical protein
MPDRNVGDGVRRESFAPTKGESKQNKLEKNNKNNNNSAAEMLKQKNEADSLEMEFIGQMKRIGVAKTDRVLASFNLRAGAP